MSTVRLLLVDDHTLVRAGLRMLVQQLADVTVVGEASDGREAIEQVRRCQPQVVLMDIAMQGLNGLEATARIMREHPQVRVLILSMHANEEYVAQALRSGAAGYLLKGATLPELELAIRSATRGETYLAPNVSRPLVDEYLRRVGGDRGELDRLTPRQREVLQRLAEGLATKEIAARLHLSPKTVETHRAQIMARLGIRDVAGLVRFAVRTGLVQAD